MDTFIKLFEKSLKSNWNAIAVTDYDEKRNITYGSLAIKIEQLHSFWKTLGLHEGDKIAICANNSSSWVTVFMAIVTGGYVAVLLQTNYELEDNIRLINHSDSKLLYAIKKDFESIDLNALPNIVSIFDIKTFGTIKCRDSYSQSCRDENISSYLNTTDKIQKGVISYPDISKENTCTIIYTSGTTGAPKGVMLSVNYWDINIIKLWSRNKHIQGDCAICISPFYHIVGLGADFLSGICKGLRLITISKLVPANIMMAINEFKPRKIFAPPILLCRFVESFIAQKKSFDENSTQDCAELKEHLLQALGGNIESFTAGGTPMDAKIESLLLDKLNFPLLTAYGLTECGLNSMGIIGKQKARSCGTIFDENLYRIKSEDPENIPGEVQFKNNIYSGYYKNPIATAATTTDDGWFKTGDLGIIDEYKNLFITGRYKSLILTSNAENIYPEEIESLLNASTYILESILVQRGEKIHAIIVLDKEKVVKDKLGEKELLKIIDSNILEANKHLPGFTIISSYELREEPLERTPKGSLKRFLYSEGIKEN